MLLIGKHAQSFSSLEMRLIRNERKKERKLDDISYRRDSGERNVMFLYFVFVLFICVKLKSRMYVKEKVYIKMERKCREMNEIRLRGYLVIVLVYYVVVLVFKESFVCSVCTVLCTLSYRRCMNSV